MTYPIRVYSHSLLGALNLLTACIEVLRERSPQTRICVVEPDSLPHPEYASRYANHYSINKQITEAKCNRDLFPYRPLF